MDVPLDKNNDSQVGEVPTPYIRGNIVMCNVKVDLQQNREVSSFLEISDAKPEQVDQVIQGFFGFFNVAINPAKKEVKPPVSKMQQAFEDGKARQAFATETALPVHQGTIGQVLNRGTVAAQPTVKHVANDTEIHGEPETMNDAMKHISPNAPEHVFTGVKKEAGKPNRYQCRYRCTKCKAAGKHFIPEGVETVDCHKCQTSLPVKKATPGTQGIQPDKFMNWFVAGEQLPVENFRYGKGHTIK